VLTAKYERLAEYLKSLGRDEVVLTVDEIEKILGFKLPPSAGKGKWWSNDVRHYHAVSGWLKAGWKIKFAHLSKGLIGFQKVGEEYYKRFKEKVAERRIIKPEEFFKPLPPSAEKIEEIEYENSERFKNSVKRYLTERYKAKLVPERLRDVDVVLRKPNGRYVIGKILYMKGAKASRLSRIGILEISHSMFILEKTSEELKAEEVLLIFGGENIRSLYDWLKRYHKAAKLSKIKMLFVDREGGIHDIMKELLPIIALIEF